MGVEPTGNNITVDAIHIHRVRNGRIVEHWGQSDSLGLMRQLGALPSGGVRP
jgi:predicted ester cyclase